jgi:hypothetical protein
MPRCKECKQKFISKRFLQKTCDNISCALAYSRKQTQIEWKKEKKVLKDKLKTKSDYQKDLQKEVNYFIRQRDKNKPCISCSKPLIGKFDAGHYRSQGGNPELRFNELNIFGQCVRCNQHLHGNLIDYRIGLIKRIGVEKVEWIESKHEPQHYTIEELKEMIIKYRNLNKN